MINAENIKRIVIVHTAFIGDIILATPLFEAVHQSCPNATIDFLCTPAAANIVETNPYINRIITYDKHDKQKGLFQLLKLVFQLRKENYDIAFVPHRSFRSAMLIWLTRIPLRIGFNTSEGRMLFTHLVNYQKNSHEVERNFAFLTVLNSPIHYTTPVILPNTDDAELVTKWLSEQPFSQENTCIAIAPGSVWQTKRWPPEKFIRVIEMLHNLRPTLQFILIGGEKDEALCDFIQERVEFPLVNAAALFTLRQSAELLKKCTLLLTNDSAPTHLGVAVKIPVITLFGPTIPEFGFAPYGKGNQIVEIPDLYCRPCGIHGGKICPEKHFRCMMDIEPELVVQKILSYEDIQNQPAESGTSIN
ncbi:lipopolysaccharide heptosyltransferase II [candidate division KSB1 bacterium]|nr:lipopolysaccharide heptosyltransferase II [candidate division KSB1 bacterium]